MIATLLNLLFILTALAVAFILSDCWVRGRNAWRIAQRELAQLDMAIAADLQIELQSTGNWPHHRSATRPGPARMAIRSRALPARLPVRVAAA